MLKVVILDGNAISRGLLNTVLLDGEYDVIADGNLSPASVAKMVLLQPQLVCIDIGYADDGMSILGTLREGLPKSIIFLMSGKFEPALVEEAVKHGVHGFIVKPFKAATVLGTIRNAVLKVVRKQQKLTSERTPADGEEKPEDKMEEPPEAPPDSEE